MEAKVEKLQEEVGNVGLKINPSKTKHMRVNCNNKNKWTVNDIEIEEVDNFLYLGSVVTKKKTGGVEEDVKRRIRLANGAFVQTAENNISLKTKLRLFNTNVKSVLLYGCETWKITDVINKKIQTFINRCHTLRKPDGAIEKTAIDWKPQGVRKREQPRKTWKRSIEEEVERCGKSWKEVKRMADDRGANVRKQYDEKKNSFRLKLHADRQPEDDDHQEPSTSNVKFEFIIDLCHSFISADIPVYKLKNEYFREFLEKYAQHTIPDGSTLRKMYALAFYHEKVQKIRYEIIYSPIWVSIDEITDAVSTAGLFSVDGIDYSETVFGKRCREFAIYHLTLVLRLWKTSENSNQKISPSGKRIRARRNLGLAGKRLS
ncbi:hypothetical protein ANN_17319 [Periplaneta americana]|uniref:DUF6451 domain-containing protein n=1 Tax=Periplaneta americana TaxID=6978 RepID=A0ABQ8SSL5_PERAM|nr:hypothetical protein ANN_17319 [Periplaneta americana]